VLFNVHEYVYIAVDDHWQQRQVNWFVRDDNIRATHLHTGRTCLDLQAILHFHHLQNDWMDKLY